MSSRHLVRYLLSSKDASRPLEVVSAADARFSSRVELSVRFGKTLLVLECDGVEPMLYPLARKDLVHQGPRYVVQVGDKVERGFEAPCCVARQRHSRSLFLRCLTRTRSRARRD